jgi:hypothetical protein
MQQMRTRSEDYENGATSPDNYGGIAVVTPPTRQIVMSVSAEWLAVGDADADEEERALISASITDEQLHALTGTRDLAGVRFLQMAVDSEFVPLGSLGERLPQLEQLKLNGSSLPSLRLIGSSLTRVRVLWLCRCGLRELDNLWAVPELQELYLAFNDIEQLSPIHEAEQLQVLDLEANLVADMAQVEFLQFASALQELTLRGNPVCEREGFREEVIALLAQVQMLDDEPTVAGDEGAAPFDDDDDADAGALLDNSLAEEAALAASLLAELGCSAADEACAADVAAHSRGAAPPGAPPSPAATRTPSGAPASLSPGRPSARGTPRKLGALLPPSPPPMSEAQRREEMLVSRGIKYAEVGRVYDIAVDGRQMLGAGGGRGASRPATARPLVNTWTGFSGGSAASTRPGTAIGAVSRPFSGSSSRPLSTSSSRPMSTFGSSLGGCSRPLSSAGGSRPPTGSRPQTGSRASNSGCSSRGMLSSPARPDDYVPEDDEASELTRSSDVICGVHKLRAHKLRRSVEAMFEEEASAEGLPQSAAGGSGTRELRSLDDELMEQLRAVKMNELLTGGAPGSDDPSDESLDGDSEEAASGLALALGARLQCEDGLGAEGAPAPSADEAPPTRPTSSTDVTPTQTPDSPKDVALALRPALSCAALSPTARRGAAAGPPAHGQSKSSSHSHRMSSKAEGTPTALRHLRMPRDASHAAAAAEILSLN